MGYSDFVGIDLYAARLNQLSRVSLGWAVRIPRTMHLRMLIHCYRYRTIADRILNMTLVPSRRLVKRDVSYEFMNRQMVWHAFTVSNPYPKFGL
jgi:hypothetical protein